MPLFAMLARDKAGDGSHRQAVRPAHLAHLDSLGDALVLAGPFQTEEAKSKGSLVVIEAPDLATARALFDKDPYVREGVFDSVEISRFAITVNKSAGR